MYSIMYTQRPNILPLTLCVLYCLSGIPYIYKKSLAHNCNSTTLGQLKNNVNSYTGAVIQVCGLTNNFRPKLCQFTIPCSFLPRSSMNFNFFKDSLLLKYRDLSVLSFLSYLHIIYLLIHRQISILQIKILNQIELIEILRQSQTTIHKALENHYVTGQGDCDYINTTILQ